MDFCVGDLVFTNFFGEPHRSGIILNIRRNSYGIQSYLTLLSDGQQVYFKPDAIITPDDLKEDTSIWRRKNRWEKKDE